MTTPHERAKLKEIIQLLHEMRPEISIQDIQVIHKSCLQALLDDAEVLEAGAESLFETSQYASVTHTWHKVDEYSKDNWRDKASAFISALKRMAGI